MAPAAAAAPVSTPLPPLAVEEEQTQITQVLQLMDLLLDLVARVLTEQLLMLVEVVRDKLHLQVQQPSTHKVEEQTLEVVAVEVTLFQELPDLMEPLLALVDLVLYWLLLRNNLTSS